MPYGDLGSIVDTLSYAAASAHCSENAHVTGDIFCVSYRWGSAYNHVSTFSIDALGQISDSVIDDINHATGISDDRNCLCKVTDSIYAIAMSNMSFQLVIDTIQILPNGQITDPVVDKHVFTTIGALPGRLEKCGPGYLALAFDTYPAHIGHLSTFHIFPDGTIDPTVVDTLVIDGTKCLVPFLANIHPGIWAVAYMGPDDHGFIKTVSISGAGSIGPTVIDTLEFDTVNAQYPSIAKAHGDYVAIGYATSGGDGKLAIVEIDSGGAITDSVIDTYVFEPGAASRVCTYSIGQGYIGVAYSDLATQGLLKTFLVDEAGKLNSTTIDTLQFVGSGAGYQHVVHAIGDVWAVTHCGPGSTGQVDSFGLETPPPPAAPKDLMRGMLR